MAGGARVVVVEDEEVIRTSVVAALRSAGYVVESRADGRDLTELIRVFRPDLLVLDWMLPGRSGLELAARARASTAVAVVFLTARDAVGDRLRGFDAGADDYLVKPFSMAELLVRVRAVLRRTGADSGTLRVGDLVVDEASMLVTRAGVVLDLTATETRLLGYFAQNAGRALSKTQILTQVWGYDDYDPNLVEVHVSALRRKTEVAGPRLITTVRGVGYRLDA